MKIILENTVSFQFWLWCVFFKNNFRAKAFQSDAAKTNQDSYPRKGKCGAGIEFENTIKPNYCDINISGPYSFKCCDIQMSMTVQMVFLQQRDISRSAVTLLLSIAFMIYW